MFLTKTKSNIRAIRPGDADFIINDGIMIAARASIEISQRCPDNYVSLLQECINQGWIKPIAYQPVHEEFMEKLTK